MKNVVKCIGLLLLMPMLANADEKQIYAALAKAFPRLKVEQVQPSEVPGLYEVVAGPNVFYISPDGKYMVQGKILDLAAGVDITESKLAGARIKGIQEIGEGQMINFKAVDPKHDVYVFTDIDCGYCRKFHSEIDKYQAEGINVHYLFFPRAGKGSDSYKKAVSVWCAKDRNAALTEAKKGDVPKELDCLNPVDRHMALGRDVGVSGTPTIVTEKGAVFPGYMPAKQLSEALKYSPADILSR